MYTALTLALAALSPISAPAIPAPDAIIARWVRGSSPDAPRVNVWLNRDDLYSRGDQARVYFKTDRDAYVTIVRIDTDGRIRVLFPIDPWEDNWARGGKTFEVLGRDRDEAFRVDDYPGVGYIFAISSPDPFSYDDLVQGDHWDYRAISDGRVRGDPYVAVSDMAERIAGQGDYDYDVAEYSVERHYDYPRFVCYDCHTYASWRYWDPYSSYCSSFRLVIYDDWYYYPYRRYGGPAVIVRPFRPGPRYVFKDSDSRNDYITRVAERPRDGSGNRRPTVDRGRTSADVGGRGVIPTPSSPRRRTFDGPPRGSDGGGAGREPRRPSARQPSGTDRTATPDVERNPRRRPTTEHPGDPGTVRDVPPPSQDDPARRRPNDRVPRTSEPALRGRDREPSREAPRNREPRPEAPRVREPSREPTREAPRVREPSRGPERHAPSAERPKSEPRNTGEPQLRRRRPN
jgi:hypothetical protein